jgi:hypothetical protein
MHKDDKQAYEKKRVAKGIIELMVEPLILVVLYLIFKLFF